MWTFLMVFIFIGVPFLILDNNIFDCQIKTYTSSAGEQLARDIFDARQKCQSKETNAVSFDIFREPHPFKNSSMNFFFLSSDNPLWFRNLFFKSEK